jgi:hypothetical protein
MSKCKANLNITGYFFINDSDLKFTKDGQIKVKRKYGKFKREVYKFEGKYNKKDEM